MASAWDEIAAIAKPRDSGVKRRAAPKKAKPAKRSVTMIYGRNGVCCKDADFDVIKEMKTRLTLRQKNIMNYYDITTLFHYFGPKRRFMVPRFYARDIATKMKLDATFVNKIKCGDDIDMSWNGQLKPNQTVIADRIERDYVATVDEGRAGVILNLEAGQGKTFIAMELIARIGKRTLIVVHNTTILFQWEKLLKQFFPANRIGICYGKRKIAGDIVVAVINTLIAHKPLALAAPSTHKSCALGDEKYASPAEFCRTIDFTIFDECHEYCSATRRQIFLFCQTPYMLGLSATPAERTDGLDPVIMANIGPILVAEDLAGITRDAAVQFKGRVKMIKYIGPPEFTRHLINEATGTASVPLLLNQIMGDQHRIQLIVDELLPYVRGTENIFVFADRRKYLETIHEALNERTHGAVTSIIYGGCSQEELDLAEVNARVIFTTYQFMGTGKSIPKMDTIFFVTPRKSKSKQYVNRIFRLGSDHTICRNIIDIVDWSTTLKTQWYARKSYYDEKGYPITTQTVRVDA